MTGSNKENEIIDTLQVESSILIRRYYSAMRKSANAYTEQDIEYNWGHCGELVVRELS
jgi:hypothetical protein